jgi:hypothetical protein
MPGTPVSIENIAVQFHTTTDDKDSDTEVQCNLLPYQPGVQTGIIASYFGSLGGYLNNGSFSRWFNLSWPAGNNWFQGNTYIFQIILDPNGHDTWRFDAYLRIGFQGNPVAKTYPFIGHALSQNVRSNEFLFVL